MSQLFTCIPGPFCHKPLALLAHSPTGRGMHLTFLTPVGLSLGCWGSSYSPGMKSFIKRNPQSKHSPSTFPKSDFPQMGALGLHYTTLFVQPQRLRESEAASHQPHSPHAALVPSAQLPLQEVC